jgi:glycosyltransferase involved in cell wall biosynthesis
MGDYIEKFLEELQHQTLFPNFEVVLDHNDPEDWEVELVKKYIDKYPEGVIKHIITTPVSPIGTSMNTCIKNSKGEFLTIWNVDDLRTPNSLESQAKVLSENSDIDIVNSNYQIVNKFGTKSGRQIDHTIYPKSEYKRGMILGPFFMFRKNICERSGYFDEQLKSGADFDFAIRLAYNGNVKFSDGNAGFYLDEGKGASTRQGSLQTVEKTVILLRYGINDKIISENCQPFISKAKEYDIENLTNFGDKINYKKFINLKNEK